MSPKGPHKKYSIRIILCTNLRETLHEHDDGDEIELLADVEHELGRPGGNEVKDVLDSGQVSLAAVDLNAQVREVLASVLPRWPLHGYRVVSPGGQ